jgi:hypothetical protein
MRGLPPPKEAFSLSCGTAGIARRFTPPTGALRTGRVPHPGLPASGLRRAPVPVESKRPGTKCDTVEEAGKMRRDEVNHRGRVATVWPIDGRRSVPVPGLTARGHASRGRKGAIPRRGSWDTEECPGWARCGALGVDRSRRGSRRGEKARHIMREDEVDRSGRVARVASG